MKQPPMIIALAADIKYSEQIITLIKSICYHQHRNVKFYLLHKDFCLEWFNFMNHYLKEFDSEIISAKILNDNLKDFSTGKHITEVTYYRYYIQQIPEDRVLYLDADTIINGNLHDFYYQDFQGKSAVAITDMFLNYVEYYVNIRPYFNAGVLLINNKKWREQNTQQKLLELSTSPPEHLIYGDQDALNLILEKDVLVADKIYNFQTGARSGYYCRGMIEESDNIEKLDQEPIIIHYTGEYKPWLFAPETLFRNKYWFYYTLEWQDLIQRNKT